MKKNHLPSRRNFIKTSFLGTVSLFFPFSCKEAPIQSDLSKLTFGLCADIHKDIQPDADDRLRTFVEDMNAKKVDFILQMGDFCYAKEKNRDFVEIWQQFPRDKYSILGNHDMDVCSKKDIQAFIGMEKSYYSYDIGDFHFVVLDLNFFKDERGETIPYKNGNYFLHPEENLGIMPRDELEWLKDDLDSTDKHTIVFSHQSILYSSGNGHEVRAILEETNNKAPFKKVIACLNGHHHNNVYDLIHNIPYININSLSYHWVGEKYACPDRFPEEIMALYPEAKYIAPYNDPLYATVELTRGMLKITGITSSFMSPTPAELGIPEPGDPNRLIAEISDRTVNF